MAEEPDFEYIASFDTDEDDEDKPSPELMLEFEKARYKKGILPKIKELEEELKSNVKEEEPREDYGGMLLEQRRERKELKIKYENGEVYPKDIKPPNIYYIQEPEPHVLITDLSDVEEDWYMLHDIIPDFAEEAFLTYDIGCWLASISSSINCCEYILKYELFRRLNSNDKLKLQGMLADTYLTFGKLINDGSYNCLAELGIRSFYSKLDYLNAVRIAIYHNNQDKARKVIQRGEIEVERSAPITDKISIPIIAFRVYEIMQDLINHFYNKKKMLEYWKEGVVDWKRKRGLSKKYK